MSRPTDDKCFRHRFEKPVKPCALCEAKKEAKGNFERAKKLFVPPKKR